MSIYLRKQKRKKGFTYEIVSDVMVDGLRKNFGHFYLKALSVADIQEYVDRRLATGVKGKTVKNVLGVLKGILDDTVRDMLK